MSFDSTVDLIDLRQKVDIVSMDVFILKYDVFCNGSVNTEIIGVFSSLEKASRAFNFYLDEIEKAWREDDEGVNIHNTFNRFCEPTDNVMLNGTCPRDSQGHFVTVTRHMLE